MSNRDKFSTIDELRREILNWFTLNLNHHMLNHYFSFFSGSFEHTHTTQNNIFLDKTFIPPNSNSFSQPVFVNEFPICAGDKHDSIRFRQK